LLTRGRRALILFGTDRKIPGSDPQRLGNIPQSAAGPHDSRYGRFDLGVGNALAPRRRDNVGQVLTFGGEKPVFQSDAHHMVGLLGIKLDLAKCRPGFHGSHHHRQWDGGRSRHQLFQLLAADSGVTALREAHQIVCRYLGALVALPKLRTEEVPSERVVVAALLQHPKDRGRWDAFCQTFFHLVQKRRRRQSVFPDGAQELQESDHLLRVHLLLVAHGQQTVYGLRRQPRLLRSPHGIVEVSRPGQCWTWGTETQRQPGDQCEPKQPGRIKFWSHDYFPQLVHHFGFRNRRPDKKAPVDRQ
jgi:hypothetical protein